jgi:hypothetical protein
MRRSRTLHRFVVPALIAALSGLPSPAGAQSAQGGAPSAQEIYVSAQRLFDAGKYSDALLLFRQAYDASKSPNARLMVGTCYVALGRPAEAYEEMSAAVAEAEERAKTDPKYAPTRDAAAKQLALLDPKVGKVVVNLGDQTDARVTVNGVSIPASRFGSPVAVDPGNVLIQATRTDGGTARRLEKVPAGETRTVDIVFEPTQGPVANTDPNKDELTKPGPISGPAKPQGGGVRTAGFVVAGIGVAGIALFGITGMMARSKFKTVESECGGSRCTDLKYADVIDSGMTLSTVANVGLAAGISGLVGGGLMIVLGGPKSPPQQGAARGLPIHAGMITYSSTF